jgi:hypothetical protein
MTLSRDCGGRQLWRRVPDKCRRDDIVHRPVCRDRSLHEIEWHPTDELDRELAPDSLLILRFLLDGDALSRELGAVGVSTAAAARRLVLLERQGYVDRVPLGIPGHVVIGRGLWLWGLTATGRSVALRQA